MLFKWTLDACIRIHIYLVNGTCLYKTDYFPFDNVSHETEGIILGSSSSIMLALIDQENVVPYFKNIGNHGLAMRLSTVLGLKMKKRTAGKKFMQMMNTS